VDFLKVRSAASVDTYRAIAAAARKHGLSLVGHAVAPPEELIRAGQKSIEHGFFPPLDGRSAEERSELFRQFAQSGIAMVPTFVVGDALLAPYEEMKALVEDLVGKREPRRKYLSGYLIEDWREQVEEQKEPFPGLKDFLAKRERDVREMFAAGVRVMPGTDSAVLLVWPGFSLHDELRLLVQRAGLTPSQAIVSATRWPAEFFGLQDVLGTIETGKIADLVLLAGNPLQDITNTARIEAVLCAGKFFGKSELQALLGETAARARAEDEAKTARTR
jgi:imidazolonepropionase-like amidohydrolase